MIAFLPNISTALLMSGASVSLRRKKRESAGRPAL
jgi:hypothetical protein